jgi:tight adherence protein B
LSALVGCLTGLAVWFSDRAARGVRRERMRERLGSGRPRPAGSGSITLDPAGRWLTRSWPLLAGVAAGFWILGIAGAVAGGLAGIGAGRALRTKALRARDDRRDEQLADTARALAAGLRAGQSLNQAFGSAAAEAPEPLASDLRGLSSAIELGTPMDEALETWSSVSGSDDVRLLVSVLRVHRRSGGDLPQVLDGVASTLRDRASAAREVRALTAQARLSGAILGALPVGFFAFLWVTSRRDIEGALRSPAGLAAIALGLLMETVAFVWIRRLLEVR